MVYPETEITVPINIWSRTVDDVIKTDIANFHIAMFPMDAEHVHIEILAPKASRMLQTASKHWILFRHNAIINIHIVSVEGIHEFIFRIHYLFTWAEF